MKKRNAAGAMRLKNTCFSLILCLLAILLGPSAQAQENEDLPLRVFLSPNYEYSALDGLPAHGFGASMGLYFVDQGFIGGYAVSMKSEVRQYNDSLKANGRLVHGGAYLGKVLWSNQRFICSPSAKLGFGNALIEDASENGDPYVYLDKDWVLVLQPQLEFEMSLLKNTSLSAYIAYRFVPKINLELVDNIAFRSAAAGINLKFFIL